MKYAAAVDIGRVKVQVALFDESYNIVDHQSFDSCIDDPNKTLDEIASRVLKFTKTICGIGISCPGILDAMKGTLLYTPNLGDKWCNLHVTEALSSVRAYLYIWKIMQILPAWLKLLLERERIVK